MRQSLLVLGLALALCCSKSPSSPATVPGAPRPPSLTTTTGFWTHVARRLAPDALSVTPVPSGSVDPADWYPPREAIQKLQETGLVVLQGSGYEHWSDHVNLPWSRVLDLSAPLGAARITRAGQAHAHGAQGEHSHGGFVATTWLEPTLATLQVRTLGESMQSAWPEHASAIDGALLELVAELREVDQDLRDWTAKETPVRLAAAGPFLAYLAARYGWEVVELDLHPDRRAEVDAFALLAGMPIDSRPQVLCWPAQPDVASTVMAEEQGLTSVVFASGGPVEAWHAESLTAWMRSNLNRVQSGL